MAAHFAISGSLLAASRICSGVALGILACSFPTAVFKGIHFLTDNIRCFTNVAFKNLNRFKNWSFNFNASYDFDAGKIAYMSCNLTRNLHCWSISASFNPVGQYKSYYVSLRASSSMLQDLKYEQRGRASSYDPNWD